VTDDMGRREAAAEAAASRGRCDWCRRGRAVCGCQDGDDDTDARREYTARELAVIADLGFDEPIPYTVESKEEEND